MDEGFELPVCYRNKEFLLPASFLKAGYSYKIRVDVEGQPVFFEPDEERNWRAMVDAADINSKRIDAGMLEAIILSLDEHLK